MVFEAYGVQAMTILEDVDRGSGRLQLLAVIDHRRESVEQVLIDPPFRAQFPGYPEGGVDSGFVVGMDIGSPFGIVLIDPVTEKGE